MGPDPVVFFGTSRWGYCRVRGTAESPALSSRTIPRYGWRSLAPCDGTHIIHRCTGWCSAASGSPISPEMARPTVRGPKGLPQLPPTATSPCSRRGQRAEREDRHGSCRIPGCVQPVPLPEASPGLGCHPTAGVVTGGSNDGVHRLGQLHPP